MNKKVFRLIVAVLALLPASVVIVSGFLSFFLIFVFPSLVNVVAAVSWISLGLSYVLFALDTLKMNKKK